MVLGELEKRVLNYLWSVDDADAKQLHAVFSAERNSSLNTIQSTLERLYKKHLLSREKIGHAYRYRTRVERETVIAWQIKDITSDLVATGQDALMAAFVSLSSELSLDELEQLENMIEQRRKQEQDASK